MFGDAKPSVSDYAASCVSSEKGDLLAGPGRALICLVSQSALAAVFLAITMRPLVAQLHEIALDGIATGRLTRRSHVELQPGYRADVLVQASLDEGEYLLYSDEVSKKHSLRAVDQPKTYLAKVVVRGAGKIMSLPDPKSLVDLAPYKPIGDNELRQPEKELKFSIDPDADDGYRIDDQAFSHDNVRRYLQLGTAEQWRLRSTDAQHPFHIHVNPFEVIQRDAAGKIVERFWKDTILVKEHQPVVIRVRFADFTGKTVLHCHILDHEDKGMMQVVELVRTLPDSPSRAGTQDRRAMGLARLPARAPEWELPSGDGARHRLADFAGRPLLLVLHKGLACGHCASQLQLLARSANQIEQTGARMVAISPNAPPEPASLPASLAAGKLLLLGATDLPGVFEQYGCFSDGPQHGAFVVDASGMVCWQAVGSSPYMNVNNLIDVLSKAAENAERSSPLESH
jgi:peroxiredoxin